MNIYPQMTDNEYLVLQPEKDFSVDLWLEHNKRFLISETYCEKFYKLLEKKLLFISENL
jgi:hypothetical protein